MFSTRLHFQAIQLLLCLLLGLAARAAPTSFDGSVLAANARAAQQKNTMFTTLTATDECTDADEACVLDTPAVCKNGTWTVRSTCSGSQHCFALPSVKLTGTIVTCTSEANALSTIAACGVDGGIDGANAATPETASSSRSAPAVASTSRATTARPSSISTLSAAISLALTPTASISSSAPSSDATAAAAAAAANDSGGNAHATTTTVILPPGASMTLPATTITLGRAEASALLASLTGGNSAPVSTLGPSVVFETVTVTRAVQPTGV